MNDHRMLAWRMNPFSGNTLACFIQMLEIVPRPVVTMSTLMVELGHENPTGTEGEHNKEH